jgi:hypothetical protein
MIRITCGEPPPILITKGAEELAAVLKYYGRKRPPKKAFSFKVYKHPEVVKLLNDLFFFKCAYCESGYRATAPVDVEHYRPKSAVVENRKKLIGYYWLASRWDNLLPSCIDCNRPRRHKRADGTVVTSGKANQFPLQNPDQRATAPGEERREKPLLLHPYFCTPSAHLKFEAATGMVIPKTAKGRATIDVCALFRPGLTHERRERIVLIEASMRRAEQLMALYLELRDERIRQLAREEIHRLKEFMKPSQPYSAMASQIIGAFLRRTGLGDLPAAKRTKRLRRVIRRKRR